MSQLVLPVGVMGLTVNGKTPTPEPGSIVGAAAIRFKERHEDTHRVTFGSENTVQCHTQRHRGWNQCNWHAQMDFTCSLGHSRQPAKELSHWMYYKEKLSIAGKHPKHLASLLVERSPWSTLIGQTARVTAKAGKQARLQC